MPEVELDGKASNLFTGVISSDYASPLPLYVIHFPKLV